MFRKKRKRISSVTVEIRKDCPLIADCGKETICNLKEVFLGLTEGDFRKQRYVKYFKNSILGQRYYPCKLCMGNKKRKKVTLALIWKTWRTAKAYFNITKKCSLRNWEFLCASLQNCPSKCWETWPPCRSLVRQ